MARFGTAEHSLRASTAHSYVPKNASDIIRESIKYNPRDEQCCIYVLLLDGVIVYVGQTVNLPARLAQHAKNKEFDAHWSTQVAREEMSSAEAAHIVALNPRLNSTLPPNMEYMLHPAAVSLIGGGWELKKFIRSGAVTAIPLHLGLVYRASEIVAAIGGSQ